MKLASIVAFTASAMAFASAQQVGTTTPETHPSMTMQECTAKNSCTTKQTKVTLDANWRWTHKTSGTENCYTGNAWDSSVCADSDAGNKACAQNCALEGADYSANYGITTSGSTLTLKFVTEHQYGTNVGSRVYLMENDTKYYMFKPLNKEFTFDVDTSNVPCGLNGALYFIEMDADGGMGKFPTNKAGAKYGTGYCDAQCPHDIKWINGEANSRGWGGSATDENVGYGYYGTCCPEMDIWEANSMANAFTPHPCQTGTTGSMKCSGTQCGDNKSNQRYEGVCDKDGCDYNPYRFGTKQFYGPGLKVDTTKPFTVVTQFITDDGTDNGDLIEIKRLYKQNGKVWESPKISMREHPGYETFRDRTITPAMCEKSKQLFENDDHHITLGGVKGMGDSLKVGGVLAMSIWADGDAHCLWLDSAYPLDEPITKPGILRGPCATDTGKPEDMIANYPNASVKFSNIKFGPIGSTY